ncbi:MAG: carboxymuconolactone decarboxylase family protein [Chloroflexi bacterium]|nr:carboxymuconolactone decarboxylase family protein [Chloroflexota bacterium]
MRLSEPRIPPLEASEWDENLAELKGQLESTDRVLNIYKTLARHPKLLKRWGVFGTHVLFKSTLPARERELLILRTGWLCQSGYEWGQHVLIGRTAGLTDEEIDRVKEGPDAAGWASADADLLRAADELHNDSFISDATWNALSGRYDTQQMIDLIFVVGQYHTVSMALNSLGVQLDDGIEGLPK